MVAPSLVAHLQAELARFAPFAQMRAADVATLAGAAEEVYFAPGEAVLGPADGRVRHLYWVRSGTITGLPGPGEPEGGFAHESGDLFPLGAVLGERPVSATYAAHGDAFCLRFPAALALEVAAHSAPFADFLRRRVAHYLALSRRALQAAYASQILAEQSLERPLRELVRGPPVSVAAGTPLRAALELMHARRIGSVLVHDDGGAAVGILTSHDVLGRIVLPALPLDAPVAQAMSTPLRSLPPEATAQDAVLLMAQHGIRHVPVSDGVRVLGLLSERDLFAMQRLSLKQVSSALRAAPDAATLVHRARDIRRFARDLLGQGVGARQLTELVSHLNDVLAERLVVLAAARHGLDLERACWLAFGAEGRNEQTIATDQDNGLVFEAGRSGVERERARWLALGAEVNDALDACGYPLCKGNVMARNPECCLTPEEWLQRFGRWVEHGAPADLLAASIYFDLRPLAGRKALAQPLRDHITREAPRVPRFLKQMADNALARRPPLAWHGGIEGDRIDLKLQGTALLVDAARLYALAHGSAETATRRRFEALAPHLGAAPQEAAAWVGAFEFLQTLRLRVQLEGGERSARPNELEVAALNDIDRRVLKASLHVVRQWQQRMALDYPG
jgi:CBS domain-containing protein